MIPKIIHRIRPKNRSKWHYTWKLCYPTWKKHNKDFEFMDWDDDPGTMAEFIKQNYPEYYETFISINLKIIQIDYFRYFILHKFGGVYVDMDMYCFKQLPEDLLHREFSIKDGGKQKFENSLMASVPANKFLEALFNQVQINIKKYPTQDYGERITIKELGKNGDNIFKIMIIAGQTMIYQTSLDLGYDVNVLPSKIYSPSISFEYEGKTRFLNSLNHCSKNNGGMNDDTNYLMGNLKSIEKDNPSGIVCIHLLTGAWNLDKHTL